MKRPTDADLRVYRRVRDWMEETGRPDRHTLHLFGATLCRLKVVWKDDEPLMYKVVTHWEMDVQRTIDFLGSTPPELRANWQGNLWDPPP